MKKHLFSMITIMLMAIVCVGLVGCGNDDDDKGTGSENPSGNSGSSNETTTEIPNITSGWYVNTTTDEYVKGVAQTMKNAGDVEALNSHNWSQYDEPAFHVKSGNIIEVVTRHIGDFWGKPSPDNWYFLKSYNTFHTVNNHTTFADVTLYFYCDKTPYETMTYTLEGETVVLSNKQWGSAFWKDGKLICSGVTYVRADRLVD